MITGASVAEARIQGVGRTIRPDATAGFLLPRRRVGFNSVFVSDHFQPWKHTGGHAPSLCLARRARRRTSRATIGTSVATPTFRYHPSVVAQAFGTLGAMFPGRVVLGVGTGESLNEVPATGSMAGRQGAAGPAARAVALINKLWTEDRISFEGQFYRTEKRDDLRQAEGEGADLDRGVRPARGQMAGQIAEGFICTSGKDPSLCQRATVGPKVDEGAAEAGRGRRRSIERMIEVKVSFDTDATAGQGIDPALGGAGADPGGKGQRRGPDRVERLADALPLERAASRWIVSADPEEQVAQSGPMSNSASPISCSTPPAPIRPGFSTLRRAGPAAAAKAFE